MECCKKGECGACEGAMGKLCGMNRCGGHFGHTLLRWFLGLVIIMMVYLLGMKVGYYRGLVGDGYDYDSGWGWHGRMMGGYGYGNYGNGYGYDRPMMYYYGGSPASNGAEATPKTK